MRIDSHFVLLTRTAIHTVARTPRAYDFQYNFAPPESEAAGEFRGRVHQGVYDMYRKIRDGVLAEVERFGQPRHVFVAGHSLGG